MPTCPHLLHQFDVPMPGKPKHETSIIFIPKSLPLHSKKPAARIGLRSASRNSLFCAGGQAGKSREEAASCSSIGPKVAIMRGMGYAFPAENKVFPFNIAAILQMKYKRPIIYIYMYMCMYEYIYIYIYMQSPGIHSCTYIRTYIHTYIHAYIYIYILTYIYLSLSLYI